MSLQDLAAVILAGGAATRLGGRDKPAVPIGGVPMLIRVLDAVAGAAQRIVVGPPRETLPPDVRTVWEAPAGGGPVAATGAGLMLVDVPLVALLAADLPFLTGAAVALLRRAVVESSVDGALFVDGTGRRQFLCGVWQAAALRGALRGLGEVSGHSMRALVGSLEVAEVCWVPGEEPPPYSDCDTDDDLRRLTT